MAPAGVTHLGVSSLITVIRLMVLLLAAISVVSAFVLGHAHTTSADRDTYVCPMHSDVTSADAGSCVICGMALEHRTRSALKSTLRPAATPRVENELVIGTALRRVLLREVRAAAWVEAPGRVIALLSKDESAGVAHGERGQFFRAVAPTVGIDLYRTADPPAPWDRTSSRVHFRLDPARAKHDRGDVGWVTFRPRASEVLLVPSSAVLNAAEGPYVLAVSTDGTITRRPVEIGRVLPGFTVVLSGLRDEERVIVGNTLFLDAERRLKEP